jgi:hypothetical protein
MVPSSTLAFSVDGEHLTCGGFSLGKTIHLGSFEFIADYFGCLSLSPKSDSGTAFMGLTYSRPPSSQRAMIEDSAEEFHMASSKVWAPTSPLLGGSTCPRHNPTRVGGYFDHSVYDDGSTVAAHQPLLRATTHSSGWNMSTCPRLATQRGVGHGAEMEKAHRQAGDGRSLAARATMV